ncbi:hypothetical protein CC80DRAFT_123522 [Byssothecium circinans]|uniref:Uncharacterized protein n=1 Tax=Byssothecium circinans TaxID=147558 RepID=A0A6A5TQE8_9PLEO|nr:hypothetical protein CC80DRAFT_123522 [Byssothecium circinans]
MATTPANLNGRYLVQSGLDGQGQLTLYIDTTLTNATGSHPCDAYHIDAGTGAIQHRAIPSPSITVQEFGWFSLPATFRTIYLAQLAPLDRSMDTWIANLMGTLAQNWTNNWTANDGNWV